MGNLFIKIFSRKLPKRQCKILMLGLDGAGKTTVLYNLRLGEVVATIPTIGFNVEELSYKTLNFLVWDVGGQERLRNLWPHYFQKTQALIYVVDSSDCQRMSLAGKELNRVLDSQELKGAILLILANKRDIARMSMEQITLGLGVSKLQRNWAAYPVAATRGEGSGLKEAMEWLVENIDSLQRVKHVKVG